MRATILHGSNDNYGASRVLQDEVGCLIELGYRVTVCVPTDGPLESALDHYGPSASVVVDPTLMVLRRSKLRDTFRLPRMSKQIQSADLVVLWTLAMVGYVPLLAIKRAKFYVAVHELLLGRLGKVLVRSFLARGRFAISACSFAVADWLSACGVARTRITVTYPVLTAQSHPSLGSIDRIPTLAVVGRVNGHKGHAAVVEALKQPCLVNRNIRLGLYGSPFPGQEQALADLQIAVGLDHRVTFYGQVENLASVATKIDAVACFPSRPEPFGLVPLEAWTCGIRAIGFADGGAAEVLPIVGGISVPRTSDPLGDIAGAVAEWHDGIMLLPPLPPLPPAEEVLSHFTKDARRAAIRRMIDGHED